MTFFATFPTIDPSDPLYNYTQYMSATVSDLWVLGIVRLVGDVILLAVLIFLMRRVWKLSEETKQANASAIEDRKLAVDILKLVKGWTVINVSTETRKTENVEHVRKAIDAIPEATAQRVVEKIDEKIAASESGTNLIHTDEVQKNLGGGSK